MAWHKVSDQQMQCGTMRSKPIKAAWHAEVQIELSLCVEGPERHDRVRIGGSAECTATRERRSMRYDSCWIACDKSKKVRIWCLVPVRRNSGQIAVNLTARVAYVLYCWWSMWLTCLCFWWSAELRGGWWRVSNIV